MKLTIAFVLAGVLIISFAESAQGTFLPPPTCKTVKPVKTTKPSKPEKPTRPSKPICTTQAPPTKAPKPPKPTQKPCGCKGCGPGGPACQGCPERENLCQELISQVRTLERRIRQCVCGQKEWML